MIRFEHFGFTYENSGLGVKDIDLTVRPGELIVLTGPSGCGKTTLTRCINSLIPDFYEGTITGCCTVCGMDVTRQETGDFSAKVGSVFQDPRSQFFTMQVRTELPFPGAPENLAGQSSKDRIGAFSAAAAGPQHFCPVQRRKTENRHSVRVCGRGRDLCAG